MVLFIANKEVDFIITGATQPNITDRPNLFAGVWTPDGMNGGRQKEGGKEAEEK